MFKRKQAQLWQSKVAQGTARKTLTGVGWGGPQPFQPCEAPRQSHLHQHCVLQTTSATLKVLYLLGTTKKKKVRCWGQRGTGLKLNQPALGQGRIPRVGDSRQPSHLWEAVQARAAVQLDALRLREYDDTSKKAVKIMLKPRSWDRLGRGAHKPLDNHHSSSC